MKKATLREILLGFMKPEVEEVKVEEVKVEEKPKKGRPKKVKED